MWFGGVGLRRGCGRWGCSVGSGFEGGDEDAVAEGFELFIVAPVFSASDVLGWGHGEGVVGEHGKEVVKKLVLVPFGFGSD